MKLKSNQTFSAAHNEDWLFFITVTIQPTLSKHNQEGLGSFGHGLEIGVRLTSLSEISMEAIHAATAKIGT